MFNDNLHESYHDSHQSAGNCLAEDICSTGYDLAKVYQDWQSGESFYERRCTPNSDQDYVYRARWSLPGPEGSEGQADLIFYRESDQSFRLHLITQLPAGTYDPAVSTGSLIVDARHPLPYWRQAIAQCRAATHNALDDDTGFELKRESMNSRALTRSPEIIERQRQEEMLAWTGEMSDHYRQVADILRTMETVSLNDLTSGCLRVGKIIESLDFFLAILKEQLLPQFEKEYGDYRSKRLDARDIISSILDLKDHPLRDGISLKQVQVLEPEVFQLTSELSQVERALTSSQDWQLPQPTVVSITGVAAVRMMCSFKAFQHPLFQQSLADRYEQSGRPEENTPESVPEQLRERDSSRDLEYRENSRRLSGAIERFMIKLVA